MFNRSIYSDLTIVFIHPAFPITMRFDVHKAILSQSPFFSRLLDNMHKLRQDDNDMENESFQQTDFATLTIDLLQALTHRGFILAPFQHIVRRKWQKSPKQQQQQKHEQPLFSHILASHIRFSLQWLYSHDKKELEGSMDEQDTLRILAVAVLFELDDLAQLCVKKYTTLQLSIETIMRDLEHICQLPRDHSAYLRLRDAALLLLLRYGPDHPNSLAKLPVDYMADVLSADLLFVGCEYERYCLLRQVLIAFMESVGKITWTAKGPVDQENKRLSGFVRPPAKRVLSAEAVRSRKRKRIPSQELMDNQATPAPRQQLKRLSYSSTVPFEQLMADAPSGGVIDKASVLSHLLRTTVNYSNMTFDQLTTVRQDRIVDESIVFRALWQREALERLLYPLFRSRADRRQQSEEERNAALDEYFDVDQSKEQERRRRILLGTPKFRFRASVKISPPSTENGWTFEDKTRRPSLEKENLQRRDSEELNYLSIAEENTPSSQNAQQENTQSNPTKVIWKKLFRSRCETVYGTPYRIQVEAQIIPRHLLVLDEDDQDEQEESDSEQDIETKEEDNVLLCRFELQRDTSKPVRARIPSPSDEDEDDTGNNKRTFVCSKLAVSTEHSQTTSIAQLAEADINADKFISQPVSAPSKKSADSRRDSAPSVFMQQRHDNKIRYSIYCLNRHEGLVENDRVDPEDRVLVPVTEQAQGDKGKEDLSGYVSQVVVDGDLKNGFVIDTVVVLEIFHINQV